jgi:hypothetical protein
MPPLFPLSFFLYFLAGKLLFAYGGLPLGMTQAAPVCTGSCAQDENGYYPSNDVSLTFTWTAPSTQVGTTSLVFQATDADFASVARTVSLEVSELCTPGLCNGRGTCACGVCTCTTPRYSGARCDVYANAAPALDSMSVAIPEDTTRTILLAPRDANNDVVSYVIVTPPRFGTASLAYNSGSGSPGTAGLVYTPIRDYNGPDVVVVRVCETLTDTKLCAPDATISLTITPVSDPPVVRAFTVTLQEEGQSPSVNLISSAIASDPDLVYGDKLTFRFTNLNASLVTVVNPTDWTNGILVLRGIKDVAGTFKFAYTATDSTGAVATSECTVVIVNVNDRTLSLFFFFFFFFFFFWNGV